MFGVDLKAQAKYRRDVFVLESTKKMLLERKNATIRERIPCEHSKDGMHYVTVTIKEGHIQSFSCECREHMSELDLKIEREIHEGDIKTCYDVYMRLEKYIKHYKPRNYGHADMQDALALPVLSPVVQSVRHDTYMRLGDARKAYSDSIVSRSEQVGDLVLPRIYRGAYMMRKMIYNYYHPTIAAMFDVIVLDDEEDIDPDEDRHVFKVIYKKQTVAFFDKYLRPSWSRANTKSMDMTPPAFCNDRVHNAVHEQDTLLDDNTACMFCGDGKIYSRMKGHLSRKPHKNQEELVIMKFFNHFLSREYRARNLHRFMYKRMHKAFPEETAGFDRLVSTEIRLKVEADATAIRQSGSQATEESPS